MKDKRILYKDYIYEWLMEKKNYIKESTYANYSNNIHNHIIPVLGNYYIDELNHKLIQSYILDLYNNGNNITNNGLADKTIKDIVSIIKSSLRQAINEEVIKHFELIFRYPKVEKTNKLYILTKREQNKLTNYALRNLNNKSIGILICLYSGIRIGELCALKWENIDFKKGILTIGGTLQRIYIKDKDATITKKINTSPKTKNAYRVIPINKEFLELLKRLKGRNNEYILTGTTNSTEPRNYRKYFERVLKKNRIKHFNFHSLRHTFATNCIALGIDYKTVSELLGHATINITLNLYVHPRLSQKRKCINLISKSIIEKIK